MIDNANFSRRRRRMFLPVWNAGGYSVDIVMPTDATGGKIIYGAAATNTLQRETAGATFVGMTAAALANVGARGIGNGNPELVPVSTLLTQGLLLTAANDGVEWFGMIPDNIDREEPVGFRPIWTCEAAAVGARTITFALTYRLFADLGTLAQANVALGTPITVQAPLGTALTLQRGNRGIMAASILATTSYYWTLRLLMSAFDAALVENKYLLGLEIDYLPYDFIGRRQVQDSPQALLE